MAEGMDMFSPPRHVWPSANVWPYQELGEADAMFTGGFGDISSTALHLVSPGHFHLHT